MPLDKLNPAIEQELMAIKKLGLEKLAERPIVAVKEATETMGSRYQIQGSNKWFLRLNSNSYLDLSRHPNLIQAADKATHQFGVGPGAVRFIDGTFNAHASLEMRIARFMNKPAARIFNSAYTANLALSLVLHNPNTYWIGDELNHNSIIRAMKIANVARQNRAIFKHNSLDSLEACLQAIPQGIKRVCIIFDGVFSMRGDYCPLVAIQEIPKKYHHKFDEGVITIMDDSHGIGAYGNTGRGTTEITGGNADIIVGTFGKAFAVNGGFILGSTSLVELVRQKADTYIYTNPLSMADCAAAEASIKLVDSSEGLHLLEKLKKSSELFRAGLKKLGLESISGQHPITPLLIKETQLTKKKVAQLFEDGILAVGLGYPVVPKGSELIRFQINAGLTESDISYVLACLAK